jgi:hypothetical protein
MVLVAYMLFKKEKTMKTSTKTLAIVSVGLMTLFPQIDAQYRGGMPRGGQYGMRGQRRHQVMKRITSVLDNHEKRLTKLEAKAGLPTDQQQQQTVTTLQQDLAQAPVFTQTPGLPDSDGMVV